MPENDTSGAGISSSPPKPHMVALDNGAGTATCPSRHSASLERAGPPLPTVDATQPNWRMMDMRRMIAGGRPDSQHQSPPSHRGERRTVALLLKSVSAANRCVESLSEGATERWRSSGVASSQHHTSPLPSHATPDGLPHADAKGVHFPKQPAGRPAAAALPRLSWQPGVGSTPQRHATPPQQVASKLVKFYGETVLCVAFSPDERLFAVAGQLGHVVLYDILTGDELFRYRLPKKVGVAALLLTGHSDDLQVLFGTFAGEFHAFRFCLATASLYEPKPKPRLTADEPDANASFDASRDTFLARLNRWSSFSNSSRRSRSSAGGSAPVRVARSSAVARISTGGLSVSVQKAAPVEKTEKGGRAGDARLMHGKAALTAADAGSQLRRQRGGAASDAGKVPPAKPTVFFRGAMPKGTPKGGVWPANPAAEGAATRRAISAGASEADGDPIRAGPAPLAAGWRQPPFSWNDVLSNCALECLALSTEKALIFMAGKTESVAVYQLVFDPGRDLLGFVKRPTGLTHCAKVTSMGIGARGELLAVGGESPTLELYAAATGQLLRTLVLQAQTASLSISRDGALLAVGMASSVKLFAVRWGGPGSTEMPHASKTMELPQGVSAGMVAFSEDGSNLAIAGEIGQDRVVSIISTSTGATMRQARFDERVRCCALDADGGRLLIGTFGRTAELYYGGSGATMRHFGSSNDTVRCIFMHPTRSLLAVAGDAHGNGTVYLYNVKAAKQRGNVPLFRLPRRKQVWSVNISPDGLWLTVGGYDARVAVYSLRSLLSRAAQYGGDVAEVAPVQEISFKPETGGPGFVWSSAFSADGSTFVVGSWSGAAYVYDVSAAATAAEEELANEDAAVAAATAASRASALASADDANKAEAEAVEQVAAGLHNAAGGGIDWSAGTNLPVLTERCRVPFTRGERVYAVAISASGERMAVAGRDAGVLMYHVPPRRPGESAAVSRTASAGASRRLSHTSRGQSGGGDDEQTPRPRKLWTAEGRDFVYTVALTNQYCAFAGTGRMVYVVSATTGDLLLSLPVSGTVQSLHLHRNSLAVGLQEAGIVAVYDVTTSIELICLPSVFGAVHSVRLDDEALSFASGHQATMYGGGGDFAWSQVPDYYVAAALIHGERHISLRCLSSILRRHPEIVNCRHPRDRHTFLQYATEVVTDPAVMALLVEGSVWSPAAATSTKIGLLTDSHGETALDSALRLGRRTWVRLLVDAVITGRVLSLPSSLEPVVRCFPALAREHPKDFIRLICRMPLTLQHETFWPYAAGPLDTFLTMGTSQPVLSRRWRIQRSPFIEWLGAVLSLRWLRACFSPHSHARPSPGAQRRDLRARAPAAASMISDGYGGAPPPAVRPAALRPAANGEADVAKASDGTVLLEHPHRVAHCASLVDSRRDGASLPHSTLARASSGPAVAGPRVAGRRGAFPHDRPAAGRLPADGVAHRDRMRQLLLGADDAEAVRDLHERYSVGHDSGYGGRGSTSTDSSESEWLHSSSCAGRGSVVSFSNGRSISNRPQLPLRFIGLLRGAGTASSLCIPLQALSHAGTSCGSSSCTLHHSQSQEALNSPSFTRVGDELAAVGEHTTVAGTAGPAVGLSPRRSVAAVARVALRRRRSSYSSSIGQRRSFAEDESMGEPSGFTGGVTDTSSACGGSPSRNHHQVIIDVDGPTVSARAVTATRGAAAAASDRDGSCVGLRVSPTGRAGGAPPPPTTAPPRAGGVASDEEAGGGAPACRRPRSESRPYLGTAASALSDTSQYSQGGRTEHTNRTEGELTTAELTTGSLRSNAPPGSGVVCGPGTVGLSAASARKSEAGRMPPSERLRRTRLAMRRGSLIGRVFTPPDQPNPSQPVRGVPASAMLDSGHVAVGGQMLDKSAQRKPAARPRGGGWHDARTQRRKSVRTYTVPWRGWASRVGSDAPLALLVDAVRATNDRSAFQSVAVQALLEFKWRAFGRPVFATLLVTYLIGLTATLLQAISANRMLVLRHGLAAGFDAEVEQYWHEMTLSPAAAGLHGSPVNGFRMAECMPATLEIMTVAEAWDASDRCQTLNDLRLFVPLFVLTSVRGLFFLYLESIQLRMTGLKTHAKEYWNYFDTINALLPLAVNGLMLAPSTWTPSHDSSQPALCYMLRVLLAASCLLGCIKVLWYTRASFRIGPLVTMFVEILTTNVLPFLLLLTITVVSFAFALHLLVGPRDIYFSNPVSAIFMTWGMSLYVRSDHNHMHFRGAAMNGVDLFGVNARHTHGQDQVISVELLIYELLMVLVQIVLLNLLIAIMSDTYTRARERIALTSRYEKAQIIWELELYVCWLHDLVPSRAWSLCLGHGRDFHPVLFPDWLHFCLPDDARLLERDLLPPSQATVTTGSGVSPAGRPADAGWARVGSSAAIPWARGAATPGVTLQPLDPLGDAAPRNERGDDATRQGFKDTSMKILGLKAYLLQMLDALGVDSDTAEGPGARSSALGRLQSDVADLAIAVGQIATRLDAADAKVGA